MKFFTKRLNWLRGALAIVLVAALLLPMAVQTAQAAASSGTTNCRVYIRNMPSTSGKSLGTLEAGTKVSILWTENNWYRIKYGSVEGYIRSDLISTGSGNSGSGSGSSAGESASLPTGRIALGAKTASTGVLQRYLKNLGYYSGSIDNVFGSGTRAALIAFQKDNGLAADGICGSATRAKLMNASASASAGGTVKYGDSGENVKAMQQLLKDKGYYTSSVDGKFGNGTLSALKKYQKAAGLTVDGICGPATWSKLKGAASSGGSSSAVARIQLGDSGSGVKEMQTALKNKGYYSGSVDGKFGKVTNSALIAWQKAAGLSADGIFGPASQKALLGKTLSPDTVVKGSTSGGSSGGSTGGSSGPTSSGGAAQAPSGIELIDWSEAKNWYKVGGVATVYDIKSGRQFQMYRFAGSYHADVEPYTAEDTAIFLDILGGQWKWTPRPVLVTYNGRTSAASLNGMPHGSGTISTNNMNGQVCIHFLNSTTHNSSSVKHAQDHQNAVQSAWSWAKQQ